MTTCKPGDRIRLLAMPDDPDPVPVGSTGTVTHVTTGPMAQIAVRWDNGRSLLLIPEVDRFVVLPTMVMVPAAVLRGIRAVRDSGKTNMLDRPAVTKLAKRLGFIETAAWLADPANSKSYAEGIFRGFAADDDDEPPVGR